MKADASLPGRAFHPHHGLPFRNHLTGNTTIDATSPSHNTNGMRPAIASINIANLKHNFHLLEKRARGAAIMAVVKANAYGHGLELIAPALFDAGCRHFAVTDATEGARLRGILPDATAIVLLSGIFDAADAAGAAAENLTPVLTESDQAELLHSAGFTGSVWIKINTGMQRLGADDPSALMAQCSHHDMNIAGIMSHLACADTPDHPLNRAQAEEFSKVQDELAPHCAASLLNSAGIISLPHCTFDFIRPGIALYGIEPVSNEPLGVKPVMQLTGRIMQARQVCKGVTLSYGASFTAPRDMQIAVVSLGYGDGLPRRLSNRGTAVYNGIKLPIVGRVCMDFTLVDVSDIDIRPGDVLEFWGEQHSASDVADSIDTIAYELFTGIDERVCRRKT